MVKKLKYLGLCEDEIGITCKDGEHCMVTSVDHFHEKIECTRPYDVSLLGKLTFVLLMYFILNYIPAKVFFISKKCFFRDLL